MATYTDVPKPTGTPYTNVNKSSTDLPLYGVAIYGVSKYGQQNNYTSVAKPTGTPYTNVAKPS